MLLFRSVHRKGKYLRCDQETLANTAFDSAMTNIFSSIKGFLISVISWVKSKLTLVVRGFELYMSRYRVWLSPLISCYWAVLMRKRQRRSASVLVSRNHLQTRKQRYKICAGLAVVITNFLIHLQRMRIWYSGVGLRNKICGSAFVFFSYWVQTRRRREECFISFLNKLTISFQLRCVRGFDCGFSFRT